MFNTLLEVGPDTMRTGSLPTDHQILLSIVCTNLLPVLHTSSLLMERAGFLYSLSYGDSIDLPTFIFQQILRAFRVTRIWVGLPYACLIYRLVTALGVSFPEGVPRRVSLPIGNTTFAQSRSYASSEPAEPVDPTVPADPFDDLISFYPYDFSHTSSAPPPPDIPSTSASAYPHFGSIPPSMSVPIDPSVVLMG